MAVSNSREAVAASIFPSGCCRRLPEPDGPRARDQQVGRACPAALAEVSPLRWGELRRRAQGISEKTLAQTLRTLERDGLVHRDAQPVIPPRVDYSLTERGRELAALLLPLVEWTVVHAEEILGPPAPV